MKRVTLELGGNDPAIVFPNVDIEKAASEVVQGCFVFSGQVCVAIKRVYVHENVYQPFLEAMVKAASTIQRQRVQELISDTEANGYTFALPPRPIESNSEYFLSPVIADNPPENSRS
ncbi:hypothetical protein N7533_005961 [Penicillium manginii]|uniref:uncharacterized protein n=1 Tax=Penicillium manginii TaxID=203109 RepID=UPI002548C25F|nr:uncharacterized protein N7533_005961 [Penicillium manginii]KAJ5756418.1 hypothetical protein N7533_005961 [Penicillium manginii]